MTRLGLAIATWLVSITFACAQVGTTALGPNGASSSGGGAPTGPAGGSLGGTYPNPTVTTNANLTGDVTSSGNTTTYNNVVPSAKGGAGTINGALKGNGSGTTSQAACGDLSNASASCSTDATNAANISSGTLSAARLGKSAGSWTPADASGAALTFTAVSAGWTQIGNMVFAYATLTYPSTANGSTAAISGLPVTVPNQPYARQCTVTLSNLVGGTGLSIHPTANSTTVIPKNNATGVPYTNALLSTTTLYFTCIYPAS